jgi:hypothetical protein
MVGPARIQKWSVDEKDTTDFEFLSGGATVPS